MGTSSESGAHLLATADNGLAQFPVEHFLRVLLHRKWVVLGIWLLISGLTAGVALRLKDIYTSETLILVDPQKVPEAYVKSTVTGDVRNRLGTLSQQILSVSRLQKIIESQNLYPEERKQGMAREDVINKMRSDISVKVVSEFGSSQDLQAFRISFNGPEPRLVAQVTNQIAALFIEENLSAREAQAQGTSQFLTDQLQQTRKAIEEQEAKLKDFRLKHIGEMPEQQNADLQLLSQAQAQLQFEADALSRAEQQRAYYQSLMSQSSPVLDLDETTQRRSGGEEATSRTVKPTVVARAKLAELLARYGEQHPDVKRLKMQIEEAEAREAKDASKVPPPPVEPPETAQTEKPAPRPSTRHFNPVLQSQLKAIQADIAKHQQEQQRLAKLVATYQARLEAIPVREQQIADLERDYQISKGHYSQLLDKQLAAQTAAQLEIAQKGEKFQVLDFAQPAERPSKPNRVLINLAGSLIGLILGLGVASAKEFMAMSLIGPNDVLAAADLPVLEVIPVIRTQSDRRARNRRLLVVAASVVIATLAVGAVVFYHYRGPV